MEGKVPPAPTWCQLAISKPDCYLLPAGCTCVLSNRIVSSALCSLYQLLVLLLTHPASMGTPECRPLTLAEGFPRQTVWAEDLVRTPKSC